MTHVVEGTTKIGVFLVASLTTHQKRDPLKKDTPVF